MARVSDVCVLGGNQSDAVTIARIAKTRLPGVGWPVIGVADAWSVIWPVSDRRGEAELSAQSPKGDPPTPP
jgi:hypothetical protein